MIFPISLIRATVLVLLAIDVHALPRKSFDPAPKPPTVGNKRATTKDTTSSASGSSGAAAAPNSAPKITKATDGSMILAKTAIINGLSLQYKVSGPASAFMPDSTVPGAAGTNGTAGTMGLNVLLHGDGGQSFIDFPNQAVQENVMGVVILAPNTMKFWGGGSGLDRTDGVAHAAAVDKLITTQLPMDIAYDPGNVRFTGVSGGSLLMTGFFMPAFGAKYAAAGNTSLMAMCGGMEPQVPIVDATNLAKARIHFQSTQMELTLLQGSIPQSVVAYEKIATGAGLSATEVGALQTVDNTPVGGHCAFDGKGFSSGIQIMSTAYASVMQGGSGNVTGIGNVLKPVVGNEKLTFAPAAAAASTGNGKGGKGKNS